MKRTKRVLGLALAAVMCMAVAGPKMLQTEPKRAKRS